MKKTPSLTDAQKAQFLGDSVSNNPVFFPGRLISLWEMNQILTDKFLAAFVLFMREFEKASQEKADALALIEGERRNQVVHALEELRLETRKLGLAQSPKLCREIIVQLTDVAWHWDAPRREAILRGQPQPRMPKEIPAQTFQQVYALLRTLGRILWEEMEEIKLVVIKPDKAHLFEKDALFGPEVAKAFPGANGEIKDAGNCLAADLNTSAVFHLMRASEWGLRYLAEDLQAWPQSAFPIEFAQWKEVIDAIKVKLDQRELALRLATKGYQKADDMQRYRSLLSDVNYLQLSRNEVMHTRVTFNGAGAEDARIKVESFMRRLALMVLGGPEQDYQI